MVSATPSLLAHLTNKTLTDLKLVIAGAHPLHTVAQLTTDPPDLRATRDNHNRCWRPSRPGLPGTIQRRCARRIDCWHILRHSTLDIPLECAYRSEMEGIKGSGRGTEDGQKPQRQKSET